MHARETGHAEVVQVEYDPSQISYQSLLEVFWNCHNPTTRNRQGWISALSIARRYSCIPRSKRLQRKHPGKNYSKAGAGASLS